MTESSRERLVRLLRPRSIAIIGGSEAARCIRECLKLGFDGRIHAINPHRGEIEGVPCLPDVGALPETVDAAFVAVSAERTVDVVGALAELGTGGAICYASGFAEIGEVGRERQRRLVEASGDMALVGPNCYGSINYLDGVSLWPDAHGGAPVERGVAVISQSGNVAISISLQTRCTPIAHLVSLGNQAKHGIAELIEALLDDPRITAIGLFFEGLTDVPAFCRAAARAASQGVPVVALKNGRSPAAARIALSHTSSMTGTDAVYDCLFERLGVVRVESLPRFVETLKFLHVHPQLPGARVVTISCSGGEAGLFADAAARHGVETPAFTSDRKAVLEALLGARVVVDNPLDYHTYIWGEEPALTECFTEALSADVDVGLLALDSPDRTDLDLWGWPEAVRAIIAASKATARPTVVVSSLQESMSVEVSRRFLDAGLIPMQGFDEALGAVAAAAWRGRRRADGIPADPPIGCGAETTAEPRVLDEWRSKKVLAANGVPVPAGALVSSPTEAVAAAQALGFPVAVKAADASLHHKTERGAVAIGLADADAVVDAVERMESLASRFIVERMVEDALAELIVGVTRDPLVGLVLMIGAGGIQAELHDDVARRLLPVDARAIDEAIGALRCAPLLDGYRGRPAANRSALVNAVLAIARFAEVHATTLWELDVNPLIVSEHGAVAADALIRWSE